VSISIKFLRCRLITPIVDDTNKTQTVAYNFTNYNIREKLINIIK
jgi:hypothetical protein